MAHFLEGKDGWLFLSDDVNNSIQQFTGEKEVNTAALNGWLNVCECGRQFEHFTKGRYAFILAPSKERVFHEFYPYKMGATRAVKKLQDLSSCLVIDPTDVLLAQREIPTYGKLDTHWNDWGAYIAAQLLTERLSCQIDTLAASDFVEVGDFSGDLGSKSVPAILGTTWSHNAAREEHLVFDNEIVNHGNLRVFENRAAKNEDTVLLFGDSFGTRLAHFLARNFTRVVYAYATSIDFEMVKRERPTILITEVTERFLAEAPTPPLEFDIRTVIQRKISQTDDQEWRAHLIERNLEYFCPVRVRKRASSSLVSVQESPPDLGSDALASD